jgi:hypothetical protein
VGGSGVVGEAEVEEGTTSKVRDEAVACSEAGDESAAHSVARVEDDKQWQCSDVRGDRRPSAWRFKKFAMCCESACGA